MNNLQKCRKAKGLTQRQLAEQTGIPLKTIQFIEWKTANALGIAKAHRIAKALDCRIEDLIDEETNEATE